MLYANELRPVSFCGTPASSYRETAFDASSQFWSIASQTAAAKPQTPKNFSNLDPSCGVHSVEVGRGLEQLFATHAINQNSGLSHICAPAIGRKIRPLDNLCCNIHSPGKQGSLGAICKYPYQSSTTTSPSGVTGGTIGSLSTISGTRPSEDIATSPRCLQPSPVHTPMDERTSQHIFRACASLAARKLASRLRSPSTRLIALLEAKPLVWADPAQPILSKMRQLQEVTIYTSSTPCTVPHLAISKSADDDSVALANAAPLQDSANGTLLSLLYQPRATQALYYQHIVDARWHVPDTQTEPTNDTDFAFDGDDFDLPSPDRMEFPMPPITPCLPHRLAAWRDEPGATINSFQDLLDELLPRDSLSATSSLRIPILLIESNLRVPPSLHEFPTSVELDVLLSPAGFDSWMTGHAIL